MIFHQLFEPLSSTYTYLVGCTEMRQAVLIDPVYSAWERDLALIKSLGLKLAYTVDTHVHADHITAALRLKQETGSRIAFPAMNRVACADVAIEDGVPLQVGSVRLVPLYTPGHTDDHFCYWWNDRVFTGDALLIDGCGRTDFQNGSAAALYRSIHEKLFRLPDDCLIYPAHDYQGRRVSTIAQEKKRNPRVNLEIRLDQFIQLMSELKLPYPKFIDYAVSGNRQCGVCPSHLPEKMKEYCAQMTLSLQG
ncbi:MAG: MBL fold metallo-hydrolase [Gammaproteobacteria bacterium]|nr:MBL fold metallo-hydrolase [Gammaproteobacteria bacterium]